jgi:hypothetical protein
MTQVEISRFLVVVAEAQAPAGQSCSALQEVLDVAELLLSAAAVRHLETVARWLLGRGLLLRVVVAQSRSRLDLETVEMAVLLFFVLDSLRRPLGPGVCCRWPQE